MAYDIKDLINKAISLELKMQEIYKDIAKTNYNDKRIEIITKILDRLVQTDIQFFKDIKIDSESKYENEINFYTYDKISSLINEFTLRLNQPTIDDPSNLIKLAFDIEEKTLALFIDIQGRLIVDGGSAKSKAYEIVQKIIDRMRKNMENINVFINK